VTVALSTEDVPDALRRYPGFAFARGFVHAVPARHEGAVRRLRAWVAGPPPMVDASLRLLLRERDGPGRIRYDKFS